jgi:hypothetical protein
LKFAVVPNVLETSTPDNLQESVKRFAKIQTMLNENFRSPFRRVAMLLHSQQLKCRSFKSKCECGGTAAVKRARNFQSSQPKIESAVKKRVLITLQRLIVSLYRSVRFSFFKKKKKKKTKCKPEIRFVKQRSSSWPY